MNDRKIIVVDVGCRWGFAEPFLPNIEHFHVFGFDLDVDECNRLNQHYSSINIEAIPHALGEIAGKKILYLTKEPACSSLYKPDPYLTANYAAFHCEVEVGQVEINLQRLDTWCKSRNIEKIDYLKIDTQGSELDILNGAGNYLHQIKSIQVEVEFNPMYLGQPVFCDVDKFLRKNGFVLWKFSEITHYSKNLKGHAPINTVDIRYDDWTSQTIGVYAGQIFWANAHYVHLSVLSSQNSLEEQRINELLFSHIGMPDVLGDQELWSPSVKLTNSIDSNRANILINQLPEIEARSQTAEARAQTAEARVQTAEAMLVQATASLMAILNSNSWRITSPLRWLIHQFRLLQTLGLKGRIKDFVKKAMLKILFFVDRRPKLRYFLVRVTYHLGIANHMKFITLSLYSQKNYHFLKSDADLENLSPRALEIYEGLNEAIIKKRETGK